MGKYIERAEEFSSILLSLHPQLLLSGFETQSFYEPTYCTRQIRWCAKTLQFFGNNVLCHAHNFSSKLFKMIKQWKCCWLQMLGKCCYSERWWGCWFWMQSTPPSAYREEIVSDYNIFWLNLIISICCFWLKRSPETKLSG